MIKNLIYLFVLIAILFITNNCTDNSPLQIFKKIEYHSSTDYFEVHGDSMYVDITTKLKSSNIPKRYRKPNIKVEVQFVFQAYSKGNIEIAATAKHLGSSFFKLQNAIENEFLIDSINFSIPFNEKYHYAKIFINGIISKDHKTLETPTVLLPTLFPGIIKNNELLIKPPNENADALKQYAFIKSGKYKKVLLQEITSQDSVAHYNKALAFLLHAGRVNNKKDLITSFELFSRLVGKHPEFARAYYCLAICNIRMEEKVISLGSEENIFKNLKKAIQFDTTLKRKLEDDFVFYKYWKDNRYVKLIQ